MWNRRMILGVNKVSNCVRGLVKTTSQQNPGRPPDVADPYTDAVTVPGSVGRKRGGWTLADKTRGTEV